MARSRNHWLSKIEALRPGDACEYSFSTSAEWRLATVRVNGGPGYWTIVDERDQRVYSGLYIEMVRLPGQTEAWPLRSPCK